jgi:hypothetical protein
MRCGAGASRCLSRYAGFRRKPLCPLGLVLQRPTGLTRARRGRHAAYRTCVSSRPGRGWPSARHLSESVRQGRPKSFAMTPHPTTTPAAPLRSSPSGPWRKSSRPSRSAIAWPWCLRRSITRLGVSPALFAGMTAAGVVGLPGAAQDRLPADVPGTRPGRPGVPQRPRERC